MQTQLKLRNSKGQFKASGSINVNRDGKVFERWDNKRTFYHSNLWISNGIWAIKRKHVKNVEDFDTDTMEAKGYQIIEKSDMDFFNLTNFESEAYLPTRELVDMRDTRHKYLLRVFKRESDGKRLLFNDCYVKGLKIRGILMGKEDKAFTDLDHRMMIMPFDGTSYESFIDTDEYPV